MFETELAAMSIPGSAVAWNSMLNLFRENNHLGTYSLQESLHNLTLPILFIWGDQDRFGAPQAAKKMSALIPSSTFITVADAGHLVWLDQPEQCADLIEQFLKS